MFARGWKASGQPARPPKCRRVGPFFRPSLECLECRPLPSLGLPATSVIGGHPTAVASGDFNGDGIPDLVTVNPGDNTVTVAQGVANGTFVHPVTYPAGTGARAVALADLYGDHRRDLIVADDEGGTVANSGGGSILPGNGGGTV